MNREIKYIRKCEYCKQNIEEINSNAQKFHKKCANLHNREYNKNYSNKWRGNNPEKFKDGKKKSYEKNKTHYLDKAKEWKEKNPKKAKEIKKKWNKNNREYFREYIKKLRKIPKERIKWLARASAQRTIKIIGKCEICKKRDSEERHHSDYSKPKEVMLLCKSCHREVHNE